MDGNTVYRIYTQHQTQLIMNNKGELIHRSTEDVPLNCLPVYAQLIDDGISLFVIRDNKILYLSSPTSTKLESDASNKMSSVNNGDGTISIAVGNQFLSARQNGAVNWSKNNASWEHLILDRAEFELTSEYIPPFVKQFEPSPIEQHNDQSAPAVSVVIPMFNAEKFIADALDSLINQTFNDYEVIVVDDCSTDRSVEVVESYMDRFGGKLKLVRSSKNSGNAGTPRNIGLSNAVGKYVYFLDSDDKLMPNAFELLYNTAEQHHADLVDSATYYFFWRGEKPRAPLLKNLKGIQRMLFNQNDVDKRVREFKYNRFWVTPWCKFSRREFLIENHIEFPSTYAVEDATFTFQCIACAKIFVRLPDAFYMYNVRRGSLTKSQRSVEDHVGRFVHTISGVFKLIEKFMDGRDFFASHPKTRYVAIRRFFEYHLNGGVARLHDQYDDNDENTMYTITEGVLSKGADFTDELLAILMVSAHSRKEALEERDRQIIELEAQLKLLKAMK
ncbi:MAG: glycosyltransferase family 2 protein [Selenomonadaceae bacterium]|nr:glycosyltransferase family 2 protein [Selenomonadaceae bacterium]